MNDLSNYTLATRSQLVHPRCCNQPSTLESGVDIGEGERLVNDFGNYKMATSAKIVQIGSCGSIVEPKKGAAHASDERVMNDLSNYMVAKSVQLVQNIGSNASMKSQEGAVDTTVERLVNDFAASPVPLLHLPSPWRITFDTNPDDCNYHCVMCEEHSEYRRKTKAGRPRRMDFEILRKVVYECAQNGLQELIPSTMGEPLLYKYLPGIITICEKFGVKLNITTNGSFPGKGAKAWAELIVPVGSDMKISWNGATKETQERIMQGSNFEQNLENLKAFLKVRDRISTEGGNYCSVTLQLTFMENNLVEIPDIVRLAISLGIDRVKGHHLWVHNDSMKEQNLRRSAEAIERWNTVARECQAIAGDRVKLTNFYELHASDGFELHPAATCPFLGQEAWINWKGRFDPCCAPDELRQGLGYYGNVLEAGLLPLWQSEDYRELVEEYQDQGLCRGCNMRVPPREVTA